MTDDDPSKFEYEAAELVQRLRADGVLVVVVGARDGDRGKGAAAAVCSSGWKAWRAHAPAMLRGIADSIEKQPPPGEEAS